MEFNEGQEPVELLVRNPSKRPIQTGSHYHFAEVNKDLDFDRGKAKGKRLHIARDLGAIRAR